MQRKEFIQLLGTRVLKFFGLLVLLWISFHFVQNLTERNVESNFKLVMAGLAISFLLLSLIVASLSSRLKTYINSRLSEKQRYLLRVGGTVLDYLAIVSMGVLLYYAWSREDWWGIFLVMVLLVRSIYGTIPKRPDYPGSKT